MKMIIVMMVMTKMMIMMRQTFSICSITHHPGELKRR